MKVFIRVDSSIFIATGHVMRCLVLAGALKDKEHQVEFICRDLPGNIISVIKERGFKAHVLPFCQDNYSQENYDNEYGFWLGADIEDDLEQSLDILQSQADLVIVDHYGLNAKWEKPVAQLGCKVMAIDDLANREHYADIILDHNINRVERDDYQALNLNKKATHLLGPEYAIINPKVVKWRKWREKNYLLDLNKKLKCLLFLGGSDLNKYTERVLQALPIEKFEITAVVGKENAYLKELYANKVKLFIRPSNFYKLVASSDFVIGAAGVSLLERFCMGVPSFVFQVADNQSAICNAIDEQQLTIFCGDINAPSSMVKLNQTLMKLRGVCDESIKQIKECVDGRGLSKIIKHIGGEMSHFKLRLAEPEDALPMLKVRNHPEVRAACFDTSLINEQRHLNWFDKVLHDPNRYLLIAYSKSIPILGVLRYDLIQEKTYGISVFLSHESFAKGLGAELIKAGSVWVQKHLGEDKRILAEIKSSNMRSIKAFEKAGFSEDGDKYKIHLEAVSA